MTSFGGSLAKVGLGVFGAGDAMLAPFAAAIGLASSMGSALVDMRAKTGVAVEALSELGYVAGTAGADLDTFALGLGKMQQNLGQALEGSDEAKDKFRDIKLSLSDLKDQSPDQQFELIADRLNDITDPAKKAAHAVAIFGKGGKALLPMMEGGAEGIRKVREEAKRFGLQVKTSDAEAAEKFGDRLDTLWMQVKAVGANIGFALIPEVDGLTGRIQDVIGSVIHWIDANREMVVWAAKLAGGVALAGVAIIAVGAVIAGLGSICGMAAGALSAVGTVVGVAASAFAFILSPIGLLLAALVGGAFAWAKFTASGQAAVSGLVGTFSELFKTAKDTIGGIVKVLGSGDLAGAGAIALAGLRVVFLQGLDAIASAFGGTFGEMIANVGGALLNGDLTGAMTALASGLSSIWAGFVEGIVAVFTQSINTIVGLWESATKKISGFVIDNASKGGFLGKLAFLGSGVDPQAEAARTERTNRRMRELGLGGANDQKSFADQSKATAEGLLKATADGVRANMDALDTAAQKTTAEAAAKFKRSGGGLGGVNAALDAAKKELDAQLAAQAARDSGNDPNDPAKKLKTAGEEVDVNKGKIQGTFSAAAATRFGKGGPLDDIKKNTKEQVEEQKKTNKALKNQKTGLKAGNK